MDIPSYRVSSNDIVEIRPKSHELTPFVIARELEVHISYPLRGSTLLSPSGMCSPIPSGDGLSFWVGSDYGLRPLVMKKVTA